MSKPVSAFEQTKETLSLTNNIINKLGNTFSFEQLLKYSKPINKNTTAQALLIKLVEAGMVIQAVNGDKITITTDPKQRSINLLVLKTAIKTQIHDAKNHLINLNDVVKQLDGLIKICNV